MQPNFLFFFENLQMDMFQAGIACLVIFAAGYWVGSRKSRRLMRKMGKMEKKIMDLNSELLYGHPVADHS